MQTPIFLEPCLKAGFICPFRLKYAEQRLQFVTQLSQSTKSEPSMHSTAGLPRQASMAKPAAGASAIASQSTVVLQLEIQRLASDRAMLMQKMQVCICLKLILLQSHC